MSYSEHAVKNREYWGRGAENWVAPGRRSWESDAISWGIWNVPESEIHALGDLDRWRGKDVVELGCGTAYVSAWMAKLGAKPVGIDITPEQLETARGFQTEFGIEFPLIEGSAEQVPLPDASFDLAISEYGASIWCDSYVWIPEAARLLRPGGTLVFLRNSTLSMLCTGPSGPAQDQLQRSQFGIHRFEWDGDDSVEFHLAHGDLIRLLRKHGFQIEDLIEIEPPAGSEPNRFEYMTLDWAQKWPSEEIWRVTKGVA
jgi:SAM-dependent methyltransferase